MEKIKLSLPFIGEYPMTQKFGENPSWYVKWFPGGHNGLDFGVPSGTPILAVSDGVVSFVGFDPSGYGNYVFVQHEFGETVYAHFERSVVAVGQKITRGAVLGYSDNTGFSTGSHLHFGLRLNGYYRNNGTLGYIDPLEYFATENEPPDIGKVIKCPLCGAVFKYLD